MKGLFSLPQMLDAMFVASADKAARGDAAASSRTLRILDCRAKVFGLACGPDEVRAAGAGED